MKIPTGFLYLLQRLLKVTFGNIGGSFFVSKSAYKLNT